MNLSVLFTIASLLYSSHAIQLFGRPDIKDAAVNARTLVNRESLANLNTVYQDGELAGTPVSFVEYYADCGDGDPYILAINIATSFKNINKGSPYSLTIRVGDHSPVEEVSREYLGGRPNSVSGSPRINLRGSLEEVPEEDFKKVQKCFLKRHRDAAWWLPGNPIHGSRFLKYAVKDVYYLGGFGDIAYIGTIDDELYHNSSIADKLVDGENPSVVVIDEDDDDDWRLQAYMIAKNVADHKNEFVANVNTQIALLKNFLNDGSQVDAQLDLSNEESESVLSILKPHLSKRDGSEEGVVALRDLSQQQVDEIIRELEDLKVKVSSYAQNLVALVQEPEQKPSNPLPKANLEKYKKYTEEYLDTLPIGSVFPSEHLFLKFHPHAAIENIPKQYQHGDVYILDESSVSVKPGFYNADEWFKAHDLDVTPEFATNNRYFVKNSSPAMH